MNINKINGIIGNYSSNNSNDKLNSNISQDQVKFSKDALEKIKWEKAFNLVKNSPDVRSQNVIAAKENLEKYFENGQLKDEMVNRIANRIIDDLNI